MSSSENDDLKRVFAPPTSTSAMEAQLINRAYALAEQKLIDGTASSQLITHFLKMGTEKEKLEIEKLRKETALIEAKTVQTQQVDEFKEIFEKAAKMFSIYSGQETEENY